MMPLPYSNSILDNLEDTIPEQIPCSVRVYHDANDNEWIAYPNKSIPSVEFDDRFLDAVRSTTDLQQPCKDNMEFSFEIGSNDTKPEIYHKLKEATEKPFLGDNVSIEQDRFPGNSEFFSGDDKSDAMPHQAVPNDVGFNWTTQTRLRDVHIPMQPMTVARGGNDSTSNSDPNQSRLVGLTNLIERHVRPFNDKFKALKVRVKVKVDDAKSSLGKSKQKKIPMDKGDKGTHNLHVRKAGSKKEDDDKTSEQNNENKVIPPRKSQSENDKATWLVNFREIQRKAQEQSEQKTPQVEINVKGPPEVEKVKIVKDHKYSVHNPEDPQGVEALEVALKKRDYIQEKMDPFNAMGERTVPLQFSTTKNAFLPPRQPEPAENEAVAEDKKSAMSPSVEASNSESKETSTEEGIEESKSINPKSNSKDTDIGEELKLAHEFLNQNSSVIKKMMESSALEKSTNESSNALKSGKSNEAENLNAAYASFEQIEQGKDFQDKEHKLKRGEEGAKTKFLPPEEQEHIPSRVHSKRQGLGESLTAVALDDKSFDTFDKDNQQHTKAKGLATTIDEYSTKLETIEDSLDEVYEEKSNTKTISAKEQEGSDYSDRLKMEEDSSKTYKDKMPERKYDSLNSSENKTSEPFAEYEDMQLEDERKTRAIDEESSNELDRIYRNIHRDHPDEINESVRLVDIQESSKNPYGSKEDPSHRYYHGNNDSDQSPEWSWLFESDKFLSDREKYLSKKRLKESEPVESKDSHKSRPNEVDEAHMSEPENAKMELDAEEVVPDEDVESIAVKATTRSVSHVISDADASKRFKEVFEEKVFQNYDNDPTMTKDDSPRAESHATVPVEEPELHTTDDAMLEAVPKPVNQEIHKRHSRKAALQAKRRAEEPLEEVSEEPSTSKPKKGRNMGYLEKRIGDIMSKGQTGKQRPKQKEQAVDYDGVSPYSNKEMEAQPRYKFESSQLRATNVKKRKVVSKPIVHPPLNPRMPIPRPPFDVREHEYHTVSFRPPPDLLRSKSLPLPLQRLPVAYQARQVAGGACSQVAKLPVPALKSPLTVMRSILAIEFGLLAAVLSRYKGRA
ncbi:hypothetical protein KR222_002441 [Zaprionus bogoriensis]|nr:hypothetical protein KR222_002441 [Zaprionus bogoriensis]